MIQKMEVRGVHMHVDAKLYTYATKKIGKLDNYISRHARRSVHAEIVLKEEVLKTKKNCICEVILHLPQETLTTKESTINMYAAIDIVEQKLKNQLKKYKDTHDNPHFHQRLLNRIKRHPESS